MHGSCYSFTVAIWWFGTIAPVFTFDLDVRDLGTFEDYKMGYINLDPFPNHVLNVTPIESTVTLNFSMCAAKCIKQTSKKCFSINMEKLENGVYLCSLLDTDKYREYENLIPRTNTDHYAIKVC